MTPLKSLPGSLAALALCLATINAKANDVTYTGTLAADNGIAVFDLDPLSTTNYNFYTTSYGGGLNANGTTSGAGGFVPVFTLFSVSSGDVVGFAGASGTCTGSMKVDTTTGLCDDAAFAASLTAGKYVLDLTEFPNVANGNINDGFLFSGDPTATGAICGVSGGKFLQADVAPCVQRNGDYAVNIVSSSPVPELPTLYLVLPPAAALLLFGRRQFA